MSDDKIVNVPSNPITARPDYIKKGTQSLAEIVQYIQIPRVQILQPLSPQALVDGFGETAVVSNVNNKVIKIADPIAMEGNKRKMWGPEFTVRPIFYFDEWIWWNDRKAPNDEDKILGKTFDPRHDIAIRASKKDTRVVAHPRIAGLKQNFVHHMNFVCFVEDIPELSNEPVVLGFCKGEHVTGRKFGSSIAKRGCEIYTGRYSACVEQHASDAGRWWGLRIDNHKDCWVSEKIQTFQANFHLQLMEMFKAQRLTTTYDDAEVAIGDQETGGGGKF
jgi:hypothetical protein